MFGIDYRAVALRYRATFSSKRFVANVLVSFGFLLVVLIANYAANAYTALQPGIAVKDIVLDHLPVVNMDDIYIEGFGVMLGCVTLLGLHQPHKIPFLLKTIAAFIGIRSFFIILTHLSVPVTPELYDKLYAPTGGFIQKLSAGNDLFFSAHTGFPFLMSLLFWKKFWLRIGFIITSVIFGSAVLLAHVHYSIDVFSAFFMTYTIFHIARNVFKADHALFHADPSKAIPASSAEITLSQ